MTQVKKAFQPIVDLMEGAIAENPKASIKSILDQVIELTKSNGGAGREGSATIKDKAGNVVAIHDYYFKRYMPLIGHKAVVFGRKEKSSTGFNTMCKEGVSHWTKQQREAKNAETALLKQVASGEIAPSDIPAKQAEIEEARKAIVPTDLGFATREEVIAYLVDKGVEVNSAE